jgi:two-component system nitrogen regulation sensor histidine kinase GlnL
MLELTAKNTLLNSLTCGVCIVDKTLQLVFMNQAAQAILGKSFKQLEHYRVDEIFINRGFIQHIKQAMEKEQGSIVRSRALSLFSGQRIITDYSTNPWFEEELLQGVVIEFNQIDRQIRIEKEEQLVKQHQNNQSLLKGLAHEIKNPLGGLRGAAQLLDSEFDDLDNAEELKEYTKIIIAEADRLKNLVDRMLGSSKKTDKECVNIHAVFEHVQRLVHHDLPDHIQLIRDYDPSLPDFWGNQEQLIQVILNIINNAIQELSNYPNTHGIIKLRTRITRHLTINKQCYPLVIKAEIVDNGSGISPELQEKLFFPMISGRADGTGLGLSIAQSLVHLHGGLIECESHPRNTCFRIFLPITGDCT